MGSGIESSKGTKAASLPDDVSKEERESLISALNALYVTQYVDKSRMNISKNMIERITMTNADLVPEVGLRDYHITFTGGDSISLRFLQEEFQKVLLLFMKTS